jgi:hypothetical protein
MKEFEMTYEESEAKCTYIATELVKVYFLGIDREKVSAEETINICPNFINDSWNLLNKMRKSDE